MNLKEAALYRITSADYFSSVSGSDTPETRL
jgi:hypothetical protein